MFWGKKSVYLNQHWCTKTSVLHISICKMYFEQSIKVPKIIRESFYEYQNILDRFQHKFSNYCICMFSNKIKLEFLIQCVVNTIFCKIYAITIFNICDTILFVLF